MTQKKKILFTPLVNERTMIEMDFAFSMYGFDFYLLEYDNGQFQVIESSTGVWVSSEKCEGTFNCSPSAVEYAKKLLQDKGELETFRAIQRINKLIVNELEKKK